MLLGTLGLVASLIVIRPAGSLYFLGGAVAVSLFALMVIVWTRCHPNRCYAWTRFQIDHYHVVTTRWNATMRAYARRHPDRAAFISITSVICHTDTVPCNDLIDGHPARPDGDHYTGPGAAKAAQTLLDLLAPIMARAD